MKKLIVAIVVLVLALMVAVPTLVFAHNQAISTTVFYACEDTTSGMVTDLSITQDDALTCPDGLTVVHWNATGTQGIQGDQGIQGVKGDQGLPGVDGQPGTNGTDGKDGAPGIPFSHAACTETGLTGSAQQENLVFCQSGIEPDGGLLYTAAINAAKVRIILGTPLSDEQSTDWSGAAITYVSFTSGLHAEYHTDKVVRIYNAVNQRVF